MVTPPATFGAATFGALRHGLSEQMSACSAGKHFFVSRLFWRAQNHEWHFVIGSRLAGVLHSRE